MASDVIIKFYSGTAQTLAVLTDAKATCMGLQTDTGKLFWKINGNKFYLKVSWDQVTDKPQIVQASDSALQSIIQQTINEVLPLYDFTNIQRQDITIESTDVTVTGSGAQKKFTYDTGKTARPCWIIGSDMHSVQPQSVTINSDSTISLELSRYLAYQNVDPSSFPSGWKLCYR